MALAEYGSLPFRDQIEFFRGKDLVPTERWTDLSRDAHDRGFMVAGANTRVLVEDFQAEVGKAIAGGGTLADFRRDFDGIVRRHGWSYKGERGWRTRVIFETNLRTSYQAGRYAQMKRLAERRPYWRYRHSDASTSPRPLHVSWDGLVLRHDDPWWQTHFPLNGWGCKCRVESVSERDLERRGLEVGQAPDDGARDWTDRATGEVHRVPNGIDPGWDYTPGRSWVESQTPPPLDRDTLLPSPPGIVQPAAGNALPAARPAPGSRILPGNLSDTEYIDRFLREFGIGPGDARRDAIFTDVTGERLVISDALFRRRRSGTLKLRKQGRERFVLLLADTIRSPDEIWEAWGVYGKTQALRRRYVARWRIGNQNVPALTVFESGRRGWVGVTAFRPDQVKHLDTQVRRGKRVYRREN